MWADQAEVNRLAQELHELRANYRQDFKDLSRKVGELENKIKQVRADCRQAILQSATFD